MKTPFFTILLLISLNTIYGQAVMVLKSSGKVVIGDTSQINTPGNYNLYVQHGVLTERVKVSLKSTTEWSDDAFSSTPCLDDVAQSISDDSHLVDMPSAMTLVQNGYELKEMDAKLLKQIEWLWQHLIQLSNENKKLQEDIKQLQHTVIIPKR